MIAAASQTIRNATQRSLTTSLGTAGATHVRFLFGFPFALAFLLILLAATGAAPRRSAFAFARARSSAFRARIAAIRSWIGISSFSAGFCK